MPETPPLEYHAHLRQLLTDIATHEEQVLASEATIASLSQKLIKKETLGEKDFAVLTQLTAAHTAGEEAKKAIGDSINQINRITPEPLRKILLQAPLVVTVAGYLFTLRAATNSVNAWMLDLALEYPRS